MHWALTTIASLTVLLCYPTVRLALRRFDKSSVSVLQLFYANAFMKFLLPS